MQKSAGAILSPFDCFLTLRGIKTLAVRMERHEANARALAAFLDGHPKVRRVLYPGLPDHPGHEVQRRQASGFGAMIAFDLGSLDAANALLDAFEVLSLAESLGGVETLVSHPATMTHAAIPEPERAALGVGPGLVRMSVGIEDVGDLLADLRRRGCSGARRRGDEGTNRRSVFAGDALDHPAQVSLLDLVRRVWRRSRAPRSRGSRGWWRTPPRIASRAS